ncbi:MAG: hypothetical protein J5483_02930 [Lachnospiraceae bacterium]|nr:hypothetical protein [Lachnospiraceae bacterium]
MLEKIEKKIGKYAIKNLIYYILGGYVIGYILLLTNNRLGLYQFITLDPAMVMKGQVWRLFTWICTVPQGVSFFIIFMFLLYFFIGKSLEQNLGAFKYNLYMFSGWFFMTLGAMVVYWITYGIFGSSGAVSMNVSTYYLNLASFLAFAVLFPDVRVYFFGVLPVKVKWLAWIDVAYLGITIITSIIALIGLPNATVQQALATYGYDASMAKVSIITDIFSIIISLLNFIIFFIATRNFKRLSPNEIKRRMEFRRNVRQGFQDGTQYRQDQQWNQDQNRNRNPYQDPRQDGRQDYHQAGTGTGFGFGRQNSQRQQTSSFSSGNMLIHRCSVCGRTNLTNPELTFRYCSKCAGNHEYCQDHLFTHVHVNNQ